MNADPEHPPTPAVAGTGLTRTSKIILSESERDRNPVSSQARKGDRSLGSLDSTTPPLEGGGGDHDDLRSEDPQDITGSFFNGDDGSMTNDHEEEMNTTESAAGAKAQGTAILQGTTLIDSQQNQQQGTRPKERQLS